MKLKNLSTEELEQMSFTDIAIELLKENKKPLNTPTLFKNICELLNYTDEEYMNKVGDFFASMTTDKRFVLLDSNEWDIKDNHKVVVNMDEDDENEEEIEEETEEIEEDDTFSEELDEVIDDDDLVDNDLDDLEIVDDEEELED